MRQTVMIHQHVHVERDANVAKVWIDPVPIADRGGFRTSELRDIERPTTENCVSLLEAWDEFFGR
jgi:hypothetical protein